MNIDKIEQEYDWFMSDEDNQLHLLRYLPELRAEVKRVREELEHEKKVSVAIWDTVENYDICFDCYAIIDLHEPPKDHTWDEGWFCEEGEEE